MSSYYYISGISNTNTCSKWVSIARYTKSTRDYSISITSYCYRISFRGYSNGATIFYFNVIYKRYYTSLLYTDDAADDMQSVDLGGRSIIIIYKS